MRTALVLIAALGLAACGRSSETATADNGVMTNGTGTAEMANTADAGAMADGVTPAAADSPDDFVRKAAISDMLEIESAKVALERTKSPQVRDFAQMMIKEHTATTTKIKGIVAQDKLAAPPTALDEAHAQMLADIKAADAAGFDTAYLDQQTKAHDEALATMRGYAENGTNPALKAFAAETAPKVQMHLDKAKSLDEAGADDKPAS